MNTFHVTAIGNRYGVLRIERHIEADKPSQAAQEAYWLAEVMGVHVTSVIIRAKKEHGWGSITVMSPDDLRAPFYGAQATARTASINARHLPADERQRVTAMVQGNEIRGLVGYGSVALDCASIDPADIEDELPVLSTLIQIAGDESVAWLAFTEDGDVIESGKIYPE